MKPIPLCAIVAALFVFSSHAYAQNSDFFNRRGVALFEPEIGVVNTGAQVVVAPTVSADRKYVTIGARAQTSRIIRIDEFPFATGGFAGPVGNAQPAAAPAPGAQFAEAINASIPVVIQTAAGGAILNQTGMTRVQ